MLRGEPISRDRPNGRNRTRLLQINVHRVDRPGANKPFVITISQANRIFNADTFSMGTKEMGGILHFAEFEWLVKRLPENESLDPALTIKSRS